VNKVCSKCSRVFRTSIDLSDMGREITVMYCGVCPTDHVYAVCEKCSSVSWEKLQSTACPRCGARGQWRREGMLPV
jgi:uncharacterized paraquat-inducible protein A